MNPKHRPLEPASAGHSRLAPMALAMLRIVSALLFLEHGTQKFLSFPAGRWAGSGLALDDLADVAGLIELVAGTLIAIGLFTRPAALLASGTMAVAYWMAHAPQGFFPVNNRGDAAVLYCFIFLTFAVSGGGVLSLDELRRRVRRKSRHPKRPTNMSDILVD